MARTRATALSAMVLALSLAGVGATPFIVQSASATAVSFDPQVDPCEAGEACQPTEVTVTVTTTLGTPTPDDPETTITRTVTKSPKQTASPKPKKTTTTSAAPTPPPPAPTENLQPFPSQPVEPPQTTTEPTQEASVELPTVAGTETPLTQPTGNAPAETQTSESVQLEVRAATPEFDQTGLTHQLAVPALILVLLALFAVLIFEGRLRRMAHAAAVRKAGPQAMRTDPAAGAHPTGPGHPGGYPGGPGYPGGGYPAGPGYATSGFPSPGYPGGTAYAPIISFVPVQTYPSGEVQYGPVYHDPAAYPQPEHAAQPAPEPPTEAVVLHPDDFDSYSHAKAGADAPEPGDDYRAPFEPLVPPEQPPADIPAGGAAPFEPSPEHPMSPASGAEAGDSEPWQQPGPSYEHENRSYDYENRTRPEHFPPAPEHRPIADDMTVEQPMPPQQKRGFWRRSK